MFIYVDCNELACAKNLGKLYIFSFVDTCIFWFDAFKYIAPSI